MAASVRWEAGPANGPGFDESFGLRLFAVMALIRATEVAIVNGTDAETPLREALTLLRDVGGTAWPADALELVAVVEGGKGAADRAARFLGAADRAARFLGAAAGLTGSSGGRPSVRAIRSR